MVPAVTLDQGTLSTLAVILAGGGIHVAWQARSTPPDAAWDSLDPDSIE